ncbi:MAG: hypothetical protein IT379_28850 [Deltaproteobacteria bacterium]|nr:hypothetical protein [Deltaproteobacteria bacterium]
MTDARPTEERSPRFAGVAAEHRYMLVARYEVVRGNDGDPWLPGGSTDLARRVSGALADAITRSRAVTELVLGDGDADLVLHVRVLHLYVSQHVADERSAVEETRRARTALSDERGMSGSGAVEVSPPGEVSPRTTFATATMELSLRRPQSHEVVWRRIVSGSVATGRGADFGSIGHAALRDAARRAAVALARDAAILREAEGGTAGDQPATTASTTFVVHRVALGRDAVELLFIEPEGGTVVGRRIEPNPFELPGRPGDFLLSPIAPDGRWLSPSEYERRARSLADRFDLRRLDDARLYHYFGRRSAAP